MDNPIADGILGVLLERAGGTITIPMSEYRAFYQRREGSGIQYSATHNEMKAVLDKPK